MFTEEHGECITAELGLGRGENLGFVEGIRLGMAERAVQLDVVEVVHVEETTTLFSTATFTVAAVEDRILELGIRDDIFLLSRAFLISFAAEGDVVHLEVLDHV